MAADRTPKPIRDAMALGQPLAAAIRDHFPMGSKVMVHESTTKTRLGTVVGLETIGPHGYLHVRPDHGTRILRVNINHTKVEHYEAN